MAQSQWIASQQNSGGATSRWADRLNVFPFAPPPVAGRVGVTWICGVGGGANAAVGVQFGLVRFRW